MNYQTRINMQQKVAFDLKVQGKENRHCLYWECGKACDYKYVNPKITEQFLNTQKEKDGKHWQTLPMVYTVNPMKVWSH